MEICLNPYIKNLNRLEFMLTLACTGRCKHCSEGDHTDSEEPIDGDAAAEMVRRVAENYKIESLMTFGGEPLLYPDAVYKIHEAARDMGIPKRQLITNGFFSRDEGKIREVTGQLIDSGVNAILLSADAFHQETIPLEPVRTFAMEVMAKRKGRISLGTSVIIKTNPAWLVSAEAENPYNVRTKEILKEFQTLGIEAASGNVIFPSGNALKYLGEYFDLSVPQVSPYDEDPMDIRAICVSPNGDVLGGNIYRTDIMEIIKAYHPGHSQ